MGEKRPIRVQDLVASELSDLSGAPDFGLDWPTAEKDAAIGKIAAFLQEHGAGWRPFPARFDQTFCTYQSLIQQP